jgi:hypothetical protein
MEILKSGHGNLGAGKFTWTNENSPSIDGNLTFKFLQRKKQTSKSEIGINVS